MNEYGRMFTLVTLIDASLGDSYFSRLLMRTFQGFERLFRVVDIRKYNSAENDADVTVLDRLAMFAVMYYDGVSYESLLARLAGTRNLVFMTSDLHHWSIFPQLTDTTLFTLPRLDPSVTCHEHLFEFFDRLDIRHLVTSYECPELTQIRARRPALHTYVINNHVDTAIFKDYELRKEHDVIIYGSMLASTYPFRHRVCQLLLASKQFNILRLEIEDHLYDADACGEGLARKINQSWLGLTTTSNFDYLVGKYFEIPACRSVVLGNMNGQGRDIFGDHYVHIDDRMTDGQIVSVVAKALANRRRLQEVADQMYEKVHTSYTLAEYERRLFHVANQVLESCRE